MASVVDSVKDKVRDKMDIKLDNIITVLSRSLYKDPWVALRELIQNAHDACWARRAPLGKSEQPADPAAPKPFIRIYFDAFQQTLVLQDNGCGLTLEEAKESLSVIGQSMTDDRRRILERLGQAEWANRFIGRFGLGILSCFIIARKVEFLSRSYKPEAATVWWQCDGTQHYELGTVDMPLEVGTQVTVHLQESRLEMFKDREKFREMIRRFADLLEVPIYFGKEGYVQVNTTLAPWDHQAPEEEYIQYLRGRFSGEDIMHVIPVDLREEQPPLRLGGVLFIPWPKGPVESLVEKHGSVGVYVRRMYVTEEEPDLLPKWARFIKGVIDSPDLQETLSRESVRRDEKFNRARQLLGELILNNLRQLAEKRSKEFREIAAKYNIVIKLMALAEPEFLEAVEDLVLFRVDNQLMSLPTYFDVGGKHELAGQKRTIYYSSDFIGLGQHVYLFTHRGWRLVDASWYPDEPFLHVYAQRHPEVELVSVDAAEDQVFLELTNKKDEWLRLEEAFRRLRIEARVVDFDPKEIPALLIMQKDTAKYDKQMDEIIQAPEISESAKAYFKELKEKRDQFRRTMMIGGSILYLNAKHGMVQKLAERNPYDPETQDLIRVLYNNALMLSARSLAPESARMIFDSFNTTLDKFLELSDEARKLRGTAVDLERFEQLKKKSDDSEKELEQVKNQLAKMTKIEEENKEVTLKLKKLEEKLPAIKRKSHITCFVAMPFKNYGGLFAALRRILETKPYFWEVTWAKDETIKDRIADNVKSLIDSAHCYIVEITDENINVAMEMGYIFWHCNDRPLLVFHQQNSPKKNIGDFSGKILMEYAVSAGINLTDENSAPQIEQDLRRFIENQAFFLSQVNELKPTAHYLSRFSLPDQITVNMKEDICKKFKTIEEYMSAFIEGSPKLQKIGLSGGLDQFIYNHLKSLLGASSASDITNRKD